MLKNHIYIIITIILTLASCDCFITVSGYTLDEETNRPIEDVQVNMLIKKHRVDNLGIVYDTLSKEQREKHIKTHGNEEKWYFSVQSISDGKYTKQGPLKTDSTGYFDLFFHTGFCPKYKIELTKEGYCDTIINMDRIQDYMKIRMKTQKL